MHSEICVFMNPSEYKLFMIEDPREYSPNPILPGRHEQRREEAERALVQRVHSFDEAEIPVRGILDFESNLLWSGQHLSKLLGRGLQYLPFDRQKSPSREEYLGKLLEDEPVPQILLSGGYIGVNNPPTNGGRVTIGACVGHRAGWLYNWFTGRGIFPRIIIDTTSGVADLRRKGNIDLGPGKFSLVESAHPAGDRGQFWDVVACEVLP